MRIILAAALLALAGTAHAQSFNYTQYGSDGSITQGFYNQTGPSSWVGTEYTSQPTRTYMPPTGGGFGQGFTSGLGSGYSIGRALKCKFGGC